jgi:hypothetical protein
MSGAHTLRHLALAMGLAAAVALSVAGPASAQGGGAVDSTSAGWHFTGTFVVKDQIFTVRTDQPGPVGDAGTWTVGYPGLPAVGPEGYDSGTDGTIFQGCKVDPSLPYGRLLGRIGDEQNTVFSVGAGGSFRAYANGPLVFRINDQDHCLGDNRGYIWVEVTVQQ